MLHVQLDVVVLGQRSDHLASDLAEVDVGTNRHAGCGNLLVGSTAFHHDRHPLLDLGVVFGVFHAAEQ
ncbi:hypothetical protein D9M71_830470 [compost metagenome]